MNISDYIVANNWGYYVDKVSQTSATPFTITTEEQTTAQKKQNNASTNPFKESSFDFKDWCANLDPSYDVSMHTETTPTRSDEEILKDIIELAKKHAQQGTFQERDEEFLALMDEYISSASPDREGILNRAINEIIDRTRLDGDYTMSSIYQQVKSQIAAEEEEEDEKEPIDYFLEMLKNKGNLKDGSGTISNISHNGGCYTVTIDHGGGMITNINYANGEFASMQISGNNYSEVQLNQGPGVQDTAMFKDDNGNIIAIYNYEGLHSITTNAEMERDKEILATYNAAYDFANGIYRGGVGVGAYDKTYDNAYNNLRNTIA